MKKPEEINRQGLNREDCQTISEYPCNKFMA